jgi:hypothetical protein
MKSYLLTVVACVLAAAALLACDTKPQHKCGSRYVDPRENGFCDMGPNRAKDLKW